MVFKKKNILWITQYDFSKIQIIKINLLVLKISCNLIITRWVVLAQAKKEIT